MKIPASFLCLAMLTPTSGFGQFDKLRERLTKVPGATGTAGSNDRIVAGLKEALQVGAGNAISLTGRPDGFFRNQAIRILLPEKARTIEKGLRAAGLGQKVDDFELSMNRAAEKAAPEAKAIFVDAIKQMTLDDSRRILTGGNTAGTEYFKTKTSDTLKSAFRPIVANAMAQTGVTAKYKQMMGGLPSLPFLKKDAFDIDEYVVSKSLDGLFYMLGEEERKIRTDPAARVTALLKEVFGK